MTPDALDSNRAPTPKWEIIDFLRRSSAPGDGLDLLPLVVRYGAEVVGGACAIYLVDRNGGLARMAAYHDIDPERLLAGRRIAAGQVHLADQTSVRAMRTNEPVVIASPDGSSAIGLPNVDGFAERHPVHALVSIPLHSGDKVSGVLTAYRYEARRRPMDRDDVAFFEALADCAGTILSHHPRRSGALLSEVGLLESVVSESPLATILVDRDFCVRLWNHAAEEMLGWTEEEVLGKHIEIAPADLAGEIEELRLRILRGESITGLETRRLRRDGTELGVAIYESPLREADGTINGAVLLMANMVERRRLEAELVQARKMETVGRLAGGIAHDFNNILTVLLGYTSLLESEADDAEAIRRDSELIGEVVRRAKNLSQQLMAFSRREETVLQVLDVNSIIMDMKPMIKRLIGEQIDVLVVVSPETARIRSDPGHLQQVLLNLVSNARDAMPDGGRLAIRTGRSHFDRTSLSRHFEMPAGNYVTISISDTGVGMDEETRARLFEPFFTTKAPGKGTGLGLATSYNIIKQSGGYISVYSEPGHGSTFRIYFPAIDAPVDAAAGKSTTPRGEAARVGRVLIVEDEAELRNLTRRVLEEAGFDVSVASTAKDALQMVSEGQTFDLLVSDVIMPGLSGIELAKRLRETRPGLPILLVSGYTEDLIGWRDLDAVSFLPKPFTPDELLDAVDLAVARVPKTT